MTMHLDSPKIDVIYPDDCAERWDGYVDAHPKGSIFHKSAMCRVYSETRKHETCAVAARNADGNIVALLPAVRVETISGLASMIASRAILYAEPLCDDTAEGRYALAQLLDAHDKAVRRRTLFTEVRAMLPPGAERDVLEQNGYEFFDYLNYVVDLDRDRDQLWNSIGKQTRAKIRRSHRRGMTIEHDTSVAGVHRIYPLLRASYARSRVPLAGIDLFLSALRFVSAGEIQIRIATHKGRDVAGTVGLYYRDRYFAWYGGTTRPQGIDPFAAIVWDEIEWAHQHGLRFYDFGGAGWPDEDYGPRTFKSRFHGALVCFGRYRKVYSRHRLALAEKGYESLRALFSQFPRETATDGADNDRSPVSERKPK